MTRQQIRAKLGDAHRENADEIRWRDNRLVGDWELTVLFEGEKVIELRQEFLWFGKTGSKG